jgi:hypothetical protein
VNPLLFEKVFLKFLFLRKDIREKVYSFLTEDIFSLPETKTIIEEIKNFVAKYTTFPSLEEFKLFATKENLQDTIKEIEAVDLKEFSDDFLLDRIEEFFKVKLLYQGMINGLECLKSGKIDEISSVNESIKDTLSFSFTMDVGLNIISDEGEQRLFDALHDKSNFVSTGCKTLDPLINGGFQEKSLTLILAGCVTKDTKVKIRIKKK